MESLTADQQALLEKIEQVGIAFLFNRNDSLAYLAYPRSRIFNGAITSIPLGIVQPSNIRELETILTLAKEYDTPLSIIGGGHDMFGRALSPQYLVMEDNQHQR